MCFIKCLFIVTNKLSGCDPNTRDFTPKFNHILKIFLQKLRYMNMTSSLLRCNIKKILYLSYLMPGFQIGQ